MDLSNVILHNEFEPLEQFLHNDTIGYLNFIRILKHCWDLVNEKSEYKDSEVFKNDCLAELHKFLCMNDYNQKFKFLGSNLLKNLYSGKNGCKTFLPERCACHYTALRSMLKSAHYNEPFPTTKEDNLEWAYYDFTLIFCPFMNKAATDISSGFYLEKGKINASNCKNSIVDIWEKKKKYWESIESILESYSCDDNFIKQLENLFFKTIISPNDFICNNNSNNWRYLDWIKYIINKFPQYVGARKYGLHWKRLYSGDYMDSKQVEKKIKNGCNLESSLPESFSSNSIAISFMTSIFYRTINQMNTTAFSMFSLSSNPLIDLYKYCPVKRGISKKSFNFTVNGQRLHKFTMHMSDDIPKIPSEENYSDIVRTFHMFYSPVNAIWKTNKIEQAISFYQFIADLSIKYRNLSLQLDGTTFDDLLKNYKFSIQLYDEQFENDKNLIIKLKNFSIKCGLIDKKNINTYIRWQDLLHNALELWIGKDEYGRSYIPRLQNIVGNDDETVSSGVCFNEKNIIKIRTDVDVPEQYKKETNYIIEFTRDNFIAFLIDFYNRNRKKNLEKGIYSTDIKDKMNNMEITFEHHHYDYDTNEQHLNIKISEHDNVIKFPIIIKRRSKNDDWKLKDGDKKKAKHAIIDFLLERWNEILKNEKTQKKFDFIHKVIDNNIKNDENSFINQKSKIYNSFQYDPEILLLKSLIF